MNKIIIANKVFNALVAISEEEQRNGLMNKEPPTPVMIFPYKSAKVRKFWMKNTPAALDIIFCKEGRVLSIEEGIPFSEKEIGPDKPTDLVIEMPKGSCEKFGININSSVNIQYNSKTLVKKIIYNS